MTTRDVSPFEPRSRERREVVRLVRRIQTLFLELEELRRSEEDIPELRANERRNDDVDPQVEDAVGVETPSPCTAHRETKAQQI